MFENPQGRCCNHCTDQCQWTAGGGVFIGIGVGYSMVDKQERPEEQLLGVILYVGASQLPTIDSTNSKDSAGATRIGPSFAFTGFWELTRYHNFDIEFTIAGITGSRTSRW